jgi:hypothetical protein
VGAAGRAEISFPKKFGDQRLLTEPPRASQKVSRPWPDSGFPFPALPEIDWRSVMFSQLGPGSYDSVSPLPSPKCPAAAPPLTGTIQKSSFPKKMLSFPNGSSLIRPNWPNRVRYWSAFNEDVFGRDWERIDVCKYLCG